MNKLRDYFIIATFSTAPFIFLKSDSVNFTLFDGLLVIAALLLLTKKFNFTENFKKYYIFAFVFLFFSVFSLYNAVDIPNAIITTLQYVFILIVLFPTVGKMLDYELYKKIIHYMSFAWTVFSIFNLPLLNNPEFLWGGGAGRFVSFFGEPGEVGAVTSFMAPLVLYSFISSKKKLPKFVFFTGLLATAGMNIASGSRSGLIALVFGLVLLIILRYGISFRFVSIIGLLGVLIVLIAGNLNMERNALSRLLTFENIAVRTSDYTVALDLMNEYFLLGTGLGASGTAVQQYGGVHRPHNIILVFLTETGVFGLISMLAILSICLFYGIKILWNTLFNKRRANLLVAATFSSGVSLLIYQFFNTVGNHRGYWLIWAFGLWMSTQKEFFYIPQSAVDRVRKNKKSKPKIVWQRSNQFGK